MARVKARRRKPLSLRSRFPLRPWIVKLKQHAAPALRKQARVLIDALLSHGVLDWFAEYLRLRYYNTTVHAHNDSKNVHSIANELDRAADKRALADKARGIIASHRLELDLDELLRDVYKAGSKFAFAKMGFDVHWNMQSPEVQRAIDARKNLIQGAGDTQFAQVLDTIRTAMYTQGGGAVTSAVIADIRKTCGKQADWQAERIARTESLNISSRAAATSWRENGVERKQWVWSGVSREEHAAIDGETVNADEPYSNGLMYPGDEAGDPSEVINCSCSENPVLGQDLLDELDSMGVEIG